MALIASNGYHTGWIGEDKIYLGRSNNMNTGHILANPYKLSEFNNDRSLVLNRYRAWLINHLITYFSIVLSQVEYDKLSHSYSYAIGKSFKELARLNLEPNDYYLLCYCKPKACHVDVLIELIDKYTYLFRMRNDAFYNHLLSIIEE